MGLGYGVMDGDWEGGHLVMRDTIKIRNVAKTCLNSKVLTL